MLNGPYETVAVGCGYNIRYCIIQRYGEEPEQYRFQPFEFDNAEKADMAVQLFNYIHNSVGERFTSREEKEAVSKEQTRRFFQSNPIRFEIELE